MGLYIYVSYSDIQRMKEIRTNNALNDLLQEALQYDNSLIISEDYFYKPVKGYKGWLLGNKEKHFQYSLYHESPAYDGSPYQAQQLLCAYNFETVSAYLYGIINCALHSKTK